jgi:NADPH-dependent 2,4-dienoyl-CoA reductase/sulfur reductase-like enzyme
MTTEKKKVLVVGAGAAGMMAAGFAARRGLDVTLLERNDRSGKKRSPSPGKAAATLQTPAMCRSFCRTSP